MAFSWLQAGTAQAAQLSRSAGGSQRALRARHGIRDAHWI
jgi:hypothetical protein